MNPFQIDVNLKKSEGICLLSWIDSCRESRGAPLTQSSQPPGESEALRTRGKSTVFYPHVLFKFNVRDIFLYQTVQFAVMPLSIHHLLPHVTFKASLEEIK